MKKPTPSALGEFIRSQRRLAKLSQRELAKLAGFSDAYLSQLERGLHRPSLRIVRDLATALNLPSDSLLKHMGLDADEDQEITNLTEVAIAEDPMLTPEQKRSLLDVYGAFRATNDALNAKKDLDT